MLLSPVSEHVHTITSDYGKEFARHEAIPQALDADFYFAHAVYLRSNRVNHG